MAAKRRSGRPQPERPSGGRGPSRPGGRSKPVRSRRSGPKKRPPENADDRPSPAGERLQKVLAAAGLGSRRDCEDLIQSGRVEVDRQPVRELGTRVDPTAQEIRVDGVVLPRAKRVYYAMNKPDGVICTNFDPSGRPRAVDLVPGAEGRLFTVGRLDLHSEGLILLTNDGELANRLTHPRYGVEKTYRVLVAGEVTPDDAARLRHGIHLAEGVARASRVNIKRRHGKATYLEMVLNEGRNREIRRVLARLGHKVLRLERIAIGPLRLGDLSPGEHRRLSGPEIESLRQASKRPSGKRPG